MEATAATGSARSLTSLAIDRLRTGILSGQLGPSQRLRIHALCERYDIGATAIREALSRLVTDGLVEAEDQRGFRVAPVSREELLDLTQTRLRVEQGALRMSIEKGDLEWETEVLASSHRLLRMPAPANAEELASWRNAHWQFHRALIGGCGSAWTLKLCAMLFDQTERYRNLAGRLPEHKTRDVPKEHRQLTEATLARNADRACTLLARHFEATASVILARWSPAKLG